MDRMNFYCQFCGSRETSQAFASTSRSRDIRPDDARTNEIVINRFGVKFNDDTIDMGEKKNSIKDKIQIIINMISMNFPIEYSRKIL